MAYADLKKRLAAGDVIVLDGATGTELERRGAPMDPAAWCGPATLENDHILVDIHSARMLFKTERKQVVCPCKRRESPIRCP